MKRGLFGPIQRGSPKDLGLLREPHNDRWCKGGKEAWRTSQNIVLGLPHGCQKIGLQDHWGPRGVTVVCVEPEVAVSVWRYDKKANRAYGLP